MTDLDGRVAWVTGGGRGLGRAVAEALGSAGAQLALSARTTVEIEQTADDLGARGIRAVAVPMDVRDGRTVLAAVRRIEDELGPVDVLVANAGVIAPLGASLEVDPEEWAATIDVNTAGQFRCIRAVAPAMVARGYGRIVTISSGAASPPGMPSASAYSASKAALDMLTIHLARELDGTGVTVNAVRPGIIDTGMQEFMRAQPRDTVGEAFYDRFHGVHERGELLAPDVPAAYVVDLLRTTLTGQVLDVREEADRLLVRAAADSG